MARRAASSTPPVPPALELERDSPVPLYHQLATRLKAEMQSGRFAGGDRYYSDSLLVERYGLSLLTIRQAVRELVDGGLLERRHGSGSYVTGAVDRLSAKQEGGVVLFAGWGIAALSGWDSMFFRDIYEGVVHAATRHGSGVMFDDSDENDLARVVARAGDRPVLGVIGLLGDAVAARSAAFAARGLPVVTVNVAVKGLPHVISDDHAGALAMAERIVALGHRRIAHLHSGERSPHWVAVKKAFRAAMDAAGIAPVVIDSELRAGGSIDAGYACARAAMRLRQRPTALVCGNDLMAIGAMRFLHEQGIAVPDEVSVTGFDDILAAQICTPSLTTVAVDRLGLGEAAVDLLFATGAQRASRLLPTRLVERGSTRPA